MIEYRNVHKRFGSQVILAGIDLTVPRGERLAIVGPSGTGKSVLLKSTIGLLNVDFGDIRIDGESVVSASDDAMTRIRRRVGYVFQYAALFDSLTVFQNIQKGFSDEEIARIPLAEQVERASEALREVSLEPQTVLHRYPAELSGGMKKRVGLARAIIGRPEILLYDEPVTGLDPVTAMAIQQLMVETAERLGATSLIVTHEVEGALEMAHRIALLQKGRLRFVGTPSAFRQSEDPLVSAFAHREAAARAVSSARMEDV